MKKQLIKDWATVVVSVLVVGLAVFYTGNSRANDNVIAEVYLQEAIQEAYLTEPAYKANIGYKNVYVWGSYQEQDIRMLGQGMGESSLLGVGLGVTESWGDWSVFLEGGWGMIDYTPDHQVVDEVSYTHLLNRHRNDGRTVPFKQCYNASDCNREYVNEYEDAFIGRIGVAYELMDHISLTVGYRFMRAPQYIAAWDIDRKANGGGYWEERINHDLSAVELGVGVKW